MEIAVFQMHLDPSFVSFNYPNPIYITVKYIYGPRLGFYDVCAVEIQTAVLDDCGYDAIKREIHNAAVAHYEKNHKPVNA